ncbi:TPA: transglutaminase domain-containing protein [Mannheimia haemolytica]
MAKWLKIIKNGKSEIVELKLNSLVKLVLNKETDYQILDEKGNPIQVKLLEKGGEVEVYVSDSNQPMLILQNESQFRPLVESQNIISLSDTPVLASEVSTSAINFSTLGYIGGGILAAGGIALAAGGGGGSKGVNQAPQQKNEQSSSHIPVAKSSSNGVKTEKIKQETEARTQAEADTHKTEEPHKQTKIDKGNQTGDSHKQAKTDKGHQTGDSHKQAKTDKGHQTGDSHKQTEIEKGHQAEDIRKRTEAENSHQSEDVGKQIEVEKTHKEDEPKKAEAEEREQERSQVDSNIESNTPHNTENLSRKEIFIQRMLNATLKGEKTVDVSDLNISETKLVEGQDYLYASDLEYKNWYDSLKIAYPYLFHLDYIGEYSRQYKVENPNEVKAYNIGYTIPTQQINDYYVKIENSLQRYLGDLKEGMSEADIAYSVYNHLIKEVFYQQTSTAFNSIGALVDHKAVCEGYSSAYRLVMNLLGIETQMVISGVLPNSSVAHVWNRIKIDGQWYNVDATWDDNPRQVPFAFGNYFLTSDEKFHVLEKHPKPLDFYQIPPATSKRFDEVNNAFFRKNPHQSDATFHDGYWYFIDKNTRNIMRAKIGEMSETVHKISEKMYRSELRFKISEGKIYFVDFDESERQYAIYSVNHQGKALTRERLISVDDVMKISLGEDKHQSQPDVSGNIALRKAIALAKMKEIYGYREDDYFAPKDAQHIELRKAITDAEKLLANAENDPVEVQLLTEKLNMLRTSKIMPASETELLKAFNDNPEADLSHQENRSEEGTHSSSLVSSENNDELKGNGANDKIFGGKGNDKIWGGGGDDYLHGGEGDDSLYGEEGNDRLNGSLGKDILVGGEGSDTFVFNTELNNLNLDKLLDFNPEEDKIELSKAIFSDVTTQNVHTQIEYNKESGDLSYKNTIFAELPIGLTLEQIKFDIV